MAAVTALRAIGVNFLGGIWTGVLVVSTTPFFVAKLGLEGFGLIGFWQLLLFVSVIFDFGLGASLVREFARYKGNDDPSIKYRELLFTLQLIYFFAALLVGVAIYGSASWLATSWLKLVAISSEDVSLLIRLMAVSIALQFITTLYSSGLAGLQKHGTMNALQMLGNTLKYLGGAGILMVSNTLTIFFAFQVLAALFVCWLTRRQLIEELSGTETNSILFLDFRPVRQLLKYSAGMFMTAICGLLLANVDRIVLSKLVQADDFGKYTLAFTAAGLLQMVILAFYRSYFPRFSELKAAADNNGLKQNYYQGCRYVGVIIIPAAVAACVFAPELFQIWIGYSDQTIINVFRLLIIGTTCSGLMWLPAALQQAVGWTRLHIVLMLLALGLGIPSLILGIQAYGVVGATAVMLVHGTIEVSLGLWLMNRVLFPGENLRWYGIVIIAPLAACLPIAFMSAALMPSGMNPILSFFWVGMTGIVMVLFTIAVNRRIVK